MEEKLIRKYLASKILYDDHLVGKGKEENIIVNFLRRMNLDNYSIKSSESPDFFITINATDIIGCELTLFYNDVSNASNMGSKEKRFFEQWKSFSNELLAKLTENGNIYDSIYGAIHFKSASYTLFDNLSKEKLIMELIDLLRENIEMIKLAGSLFLQELDFINFPLLRSIVNKIYLQNCYPERYLLWWCAHLQSGPIMCPERRLIEIVNNKNEKANKYNWKNAKHKWLIIFAEGLGLNDVAWLEDDPNLVNKCDKAIIFDKIYLWDKFNEDIIELFPSYTYIQYGRNLAPVRLTM